MTKEAPSEGKFLLNKKKGQGRKRKEIGGPSCLILNIFWEGFESN